MPDGYINNSQRVPAVQIGSINKELAIQASSVSAKPWYASIYLHEPLQGRRPW